MFSHLSVRSFYSFGYGTASVEALCQRAQALGFHELALTDVNGLYAIGWFYRACQTCNLTPIIGAEIRHESGRAVLLPYSRAGYANLCQIISNRHLNPDFQLSQALKANNADLFAITDHISTLENIADHFGSGRLYAEIRSGQSERSSLLAFVERLGIPPVVTGDVHFLDKEDYDLHARVCAMAQKKTVKTVPREELAHREAWLKGAEKMEREFAPYFEALANTEIIAEKCRQFRFQAKKLVFPRYSGKNGKTAASELRRLALDAVEEKYMGSAPVKERLERELDMITRKGFSDTFLVMRDIVKLAKYHCGRGSAAASLVSYLLEITDVDPISCDLFFGRFLNDAREDPPDIDMDFCYGQRKEIIEAIFDKYGDGKVAMVANHVTMGFRQAVRRTAELEGVPQDEISLVTRHFTGWGGSVQKFLKSHPMFKKTKISDRWPEIFKYAERLVGLPTHLSVHSGGVVIAPDGIDEHIPRQRSRNGVVIIQTEKDQTEDFLKMVKFDILGNSSLCVLTSALQAVKKEYGRQIDYRDWRFFASDPKVVARLSAAKTMACFHIESASFLQLLEKIGPGLKTAGPQKIFDTLVILSSIIRPASNAYIREFLRRFFGGDFAYLHPKLEPVLSETLGIMVYQEHVNLVAMSLAGFSEIEADQLRKALTGKKSQARIRELMRKYVDGCEQNGVSRKVALETARQLMQFTNYSFLKAHSASYIILSLVCTWLKCHYPAVFMAARLSHPGGFWGFRAYISECKHLGLKILLPEINASEIECTGKDDWLRIGFGRVKGVSLRTKERMIAEREKNGRFKSFADFLQRVAPSRDEEMRLLIMSGAFDELEPELKQSALQYLYACWANYKDSVEIDEWYDDQKRKAGRLCQPYDEQRKMRHEQEVFGAPVSYHPLDFCADRLQKIKRIYAKDLKKHVNRSVRLIGVPLAHKDVTTRHNDSMQFWAFEDESGVFHCVVFPRAYERFCRLFVTEKVLLISGVVQEEYGALSVNVNRVAGVPVAS